MAHFLIKSIKSTFVKINSLEGKEVRPDEESKCESSEKEEAWQRTSFIANSWFRTSAARLGYFLQNFRYKFSYKSSPNIFGLF